MTGPLLPDDLMTKIPEVCYSIGASFKIPTVLKAKLSTCKQSREVANLTARKPHIPTSNQQNFSERYKPPKFFLQVNPYFPTDKKFKTISKKVCMFGCQSCFCQPVFAIFA